MHNATKMLLLLILHTLRVLSDKEVPSFSGDNYTHRAAIGQIAPFLNNSEEIKIVSLLFLYEFNYPNT